MPSAPSAGLQARQRRIAATRVAGADLARISEAASRQLGTTLPSPEAQAGVSLDLPMSFNVQDFLDSLIAASITNLAPTAAQGLAIAVAPSGSFAYSAAPPSGSVWVLGDDLSVSTDTTGSGLLATATVDGSRVLFPTFPLMRAEYRFRLARFVVVTASLAFVVTNALETTATVNSVVQYSPLNAAVYSQTLVPILQRIYQVEQAYAAAIRAAGGGGS